MSTKSYDPSSGGGTQAPEDAVQAKINAAGDEQSLLTLMSSTAPRASSKGAQKAASWTNETLRTSTVYQQLCAAAGQDNGSEAAVQALISRYELDPGTLKAWTVKKMTGSDMRGDA